MHERKPVPCEPEQSLPWRMAGRDFDPNGRKSTLRELFLIGGLFPLRRVADRLPFSLATLRRLASREEWRPCFPCVRAGLGSRAALTFIHLDRFNDCLESMDGGWAREEARAILAPPVPEA